MMDKNTKSTVVFFRSTYSLLKSTIQIQAALNYAKEHEVTDVVLVDEGTMAGVIPFYQQMIKNGIHPHIGVEFRFDDFHIVCIAKNNRGYQSLLSITSQYNTKGIAKEMLIRSMEELIVVFYEASDEIITVIKQMNSIDCYVQSHAHAEQMANNHMLSKIDVPIANYIAPGDKSVLNLLAAIDENKELTQTIFTEQAVQIKRIFINK